VNAEALDLWKRALEALKVADETARLSPDAAASRAYYAAFYAVCALFVAEGRTFKRHSAVEAAVHGELVRQRRWPADLGASFTKLRRLRETGDYGGGQHVTEQEARAAVATAQTITHAVSQAYPNDFPLSA
jgi:uncharacterized protein (UPF0332 family)